MPSSPSALTASVGGSNNTGRTASGPHDLHNYVAHPGCAVGLSMGTVDNTIRTSDWRAYGRDRLKNNPCEAYVILTARILALNAPPGINGMATSLEVVAFDWPLFNSSVTALYGFLDQRARELKNKEIQDANKRGGDVKY